METAIVTITCPSCGGKVEGIRTTGAEQTIPCSYCRTELHVPRVGEVIVRETKVVKEIRTVEAAPIPVYEPLRRPPPPILPAFIVAGIGAVVLLVFLAWQRSRSNDIIEQFDRDHAEREACEVRCKSQCANAPHSDTSSPSTGDPKLDRELAETMRSADIMLCESKCKQDADCFGLKRPR